MMTEAKMELAAAILATAAEGEKLTHGDPAVLWAQAAMAGTRDPDLQFLVAVTCHHNLTSAKAWANWIIAKGSP